MCGGRHLFLSPGARVEIFPFLLYFLSVIYHCVCVRVCISIYVTYYIQFNFNFKTYTNIFIEIFISKEFEFIEDCYYKGRSNKNRKPAIKQISGKTRQNYLLLCIWRVIEIKMKMHKST